MSSLAARVVACGRCPRLREHCRAIARVRRRAYRGERYWGRPVPPFGAGRARLLVVGLAPGAHGANRTGRIFTGDASGDWLYREMHAAGFANQPSSTRRRDGLCLLDARVTCIVRCAPPDNRPSPAEIDACRPFLVEELVACRHVRVVVALGHLALRSFLRAWVSAGRPPFAPRPRFTHGGEATAADGAVTLLCSYHPSRQNTQTGRLTRAMFRQVFARARRLLDA